MNTKNYILSILFLFILSNANSQKIVKILENDDLPKLEKFINSKADFNEVIKINDNNIHPLVFSINEEAVNCFKYILENKESLNVSDQIISEAFIYSLSKEDDYYAQELFKKNPNINDQCTVCNGNNAIMTAATHGKKEWYFKLKDLSDLFYTNKSGANLVHAASTGLSKEILIDVLSIVGIDTLINSTDNENLTPLDYAVRNTEVDLFGILIEGGADPDKAWNLTYAACYNFNYKYFYSDLFSKYVMADLWKTDQNGYNALGIATFWDPMLIEQFELEQNSIQFLFITEILIRMNQDLVENNCENYNTKNLTNPEVFNGIWYLLSYFGEYFPVEFEHLMEAVLRHSSIIKACGKNPPIDKKIFKKGCKILGKEYLIGMYEVYEFETPE